MLQIGRKKSLQIKVPNKIIYKMRFKNTKSKEILGRKNFSSTLLDVVVGSLQIKLRKQISKRKRQI